MSSNFIPVESKLFHPGCPLTHKNPNQSNVKQSRPKRGNLPVSPHIALGTRT